MTFAGCVFDTKQNPTNGGVNLWLRCISIGRTRDILDLLSLGKSIEKILQRYPV